MYEVSDNIFYRLMGWIRVTVNESIETVTWATNNTTGMWHVHSPKPGVQQFFFYHYTDADRFRKQWA